MKPDPQAILSLALRRGDYRTAQAQLRLIPSQSIELQLTRADVLRNVGRPLDAVRLLSDELSIDRLDPSQRGRALRIKGEALVALGMVDLALESLERSILESEATCAFGEAALASLSTFTLTVNSRSEEESGRALARARRAVAKTSERLLLAWLHARVGQAHAQHGLPGMAISHLHDALRLTEDDEYLPLIAFASLALCGAEFLLARYKRARVWARKAKDAAIEGGLTHVAAAAAANLALLEYRLGNYRLARELCMMLLEDTELPPLTAGPILDTLASICLVEGRLDEASRHIESVEAVVERTGSSTFLSVDISQTHAQFLLARGKEDEAIQQLNVGAERAVRRGDRASLEKLLLLRAEAWLRKGARDASDEDLARAADLDHRRSIDAIALRARVNGVHRLASNDTHQALVCCGRALRLYRATGDRPNISAVRRLQRECLASRRAGVGRGRIARIRVRQRLANELDHLQSLAPYPEVLGGEIARVLAKLAPSVSARLEQGRDKVDDAGLDRHVYLGHIGATLYTLVVRVGAAQDAERELAEFVLKFIERAVAAERAHQESSSSSLRLDDIDIEPQGRYGLFVAASMQRLLREAQQAARTLIPILILGETGVGKEVLAAEIHASSRRADKPFIPFNVTAVSRDLLESQLFGAKKGSFTGATHDSKGLLREADGGTVFLDEIGEMSLDLQPKLLRFVEQGEIQPVGERPQRVDVRIIAATNASLLDLVRQGRFREDLYHRLRVLYLTIPPLRERREEIATLARHFIARHAEAMDRPAPDITPRALERLVAADWPGNVRQLHNELRRVLALLPPDTVIDLEHLSPELQQPPVGSATAFDSPAGRLSLNLERPLEPLIADVERAAIDHAMTMSGGNMSKAARRLGITRKGLYLKRQRLGMDEN